MPSSPAFKAFSGCCGSCADLAEEMPPTAPFLFAKAAVPWPTMATLLPKASPKVLATPCVVTAVSLQEASCLAKRVDHFCFCWSVTTVLYWAIAQGEHCSQNAYSPHDFYPEALVAPCAVASGTDIQLVSSQFAHVAIQHRDFRPRLQPPWAHDDSSTLGLITLVILSSELCLGARNGP